MKEIKLPDELMKLIYQQAQMNEKDEEFNEKIDEAVSGEIPDKYMEELMQEMEELRLIYPVATTAGVKQSVALAGKIQSIYYDAANLFAVMPESLRDHCFKIFIYNMKRAVVAAELQHKETQKSDREYKADSKGKSV